MTIPDTQALLALCDEAIAYGDSKHEELATALREHTLSSASRPTEGEIAEIRKRHDDVETLRHASMSQVGGMEHWVISFGMRAHFDRATLLRLLESRTAGADSPPPRTDTGVSREQIIMIIAEWVSRDCLLRDLVTGADANELADAFMAILNEQVKS